MRAILSRLDGKLTAADETPLDLAELLAALEAQPCPNGQDWREAITCYLSASEGWKDACQLLGGAFAGDGAEPGLREDKEP